MAEGVNRWHKMILVVPTKGSDKFCLNIPSKMQLL